MKDNLQNDETLQSLYMTLADQILRYQW